MAIEPTLSTTALDQSEESSTTALYRAAIGPVSTDYYARVFSRFEAADRSGIHWNWAAAINTVNWFAFRQLWAAALAYSSSVVGLALLVFGIGRLVFQFSDAMALAALGVLMAIAVVVPGLYGNALLHTECRKKMEKALASNTTLPEACTVLTQLAPGRKRMGAIAAVNAALIALAVAAYFNFPQPGDFMAGLSPAKAIGDTPTPATPVSAPAPASAPASAPVSAPASAPAATPASTPASTPISAPAPALIAAAPTPMASSPAGAASGRSAAGVIQTAPPAKRMEPVAPSPTPASAPASKTSAPQSKASAAAIKPSVPVPTASKPAVAPKPAVSAALSAGFYINVGLFAEDANARKAHAKLIEAGLRAFVEDVKYPRGLRHRVRVGPFETEALANAAADRIHGLDLEAVVFQQK